MDKKNSDRVYLLGHLIHVLLCLGLFALIGFVVYYLQSGWPLFGLMFSPTYHHDYDKDSKTDDIVDAELEELDKK